MRASPEYREILFEDKDAVAFEAGAFFQNTEAQEIVQQFISGYQGGAVHPGDRLGLVPFFYFLHPLPCHDAA